jgi:glycosyltransferase involved in cell wall biosynthesis
MVDVSIILATRNEKKHIGRTLGKALESSDEVEEHGVSTGIIVADNSSSAR